MLVWIFKTKKYTCNVVKDFGVALGGFSYIGEVKASSPYLCISGEGWREISVQISSLATNYKALCQKVCPALNYRNVKSEIEGKMNSS